MPRRACEKARSNEPLDLRDRAHHRHAWQSAARRISHSPAGGDVRDASSSDGGPRLLDVPTAVTQL